MSDLSAGPIRRIILELADGSGYVAFVVNATTAAAMLPGGLCQVRQDGKAYAFGFAGNAPVQPAPFPPIPWADFLANGPATVLVLNDPGGTVLAPPGAKPLTITALSAG